MKPESASLRAVVFIDGQNLFRSAKEAFGHTYPNYDPMSLAQAVCTREGWNLRQVRFYTGYPDSEDNPFWNHFWTAKQWRDAHPDVEGNIRDSFLQTLHAMKTNTICPVDPIRAQTSGLAAA
jgi:hypothetical protein